MAAEAPYFDAAYLARLYLQDTGHEAVRELAAPAEFVVSAWHGQAEVMSAIFRVLREGRITEAGRAALLRQFSQDSADGLYRWLPFTPSVRNRLAEFYLRAPSVLPLRAADALHLACAADHGFDTVYSNDRHLLAAAAHFGLRGVDVIPA